MKELTTDSLDLVTGGAFRAVGDFIGIPGMTETMAWTYRTAVTAAGRLKYQTKFGDDKPSRWFKMGK